MPSGKVLKGAIEGFLGTYTSRYSDVDGYWLFGLIVADLDEIRVDLMQPTLEVASAPGEWVVKYARDRFADQLNKAGFPAERIREGSLLIRRLPTPVKVDVNGHIRDGSDVRFVVDAVLNTGRRFTSERTVGVAPHDASVELRSARAA